MIKVFWKRIDIIENFSNVGRGKHSSFVSFKSDFFDLGIVMGTVEMVESEQ